jgi:hypothetical protein
VLKFCPSAFIYSSGQPRLSMAPQPTSVRKFSHEEAENRKAAHEASGGNKSQASEQPDPEDEEAVQVANLYAERQHAARGICLASLASLAHT